MLMTPLAVTMILSQRFLPAFLVFILAGVSDAVDGFIAKNSICAQNSAPISIRLPTKRC